MPFVQSIYIGALFAVCALCLAGAWRALLDAEPMRRTAIVIFANWSTNTAFVLATGLFSPWAFFIVTDSLSARLILHQPAGKAQSAIGWLYMAQVIIHCVYGIAGHGEQRAYWLVLTTLAFVQLIVLGGWRSGFGGHRDPLHGGASTVAGKTRRKGVA